MRHRLPIDAAGFTTRPQLAALCEELGKSGLIELLADTPALVADLSETPKASAAAGGLTHYGEEQSKSQPSGKSEAVYEVGFLLKAPGAPFPGLVTVGRAKACDLQLCLPTVSKIHAYFALEDKTWFLVDQQSMNKTRRNGDELTAGARVELQDGDAIKFGLEHPYRLVFPARLVDWIATGSAALRLSA